MAHPFDNFGVKAAKPFAPVTRPPFAKPSAMPPRRMPPSPAPVTQPRATVPKTSAPKLPKLSEVSARARLGK